MEFSARIIDKVGHLDIPLEAESSAKALLKAYKIKLFIDQHFSLIPQDDKNLFDIDSVCGVYRHDRDFIEHQTVWSKMTGFIDTL